MFKKPKPDSVSVAIRELNVMPVLSAWSAPERILRPDEIRALALLAMRVSRLKRDRDPQALTTEAKAGVMIKAGLTKEGPWAMTDEVFGGSDTALAVIGHAMPEWRKWMWPRSGQSVFQG